MATKIACFIVDPMGAKTEPLPADCEEVQDIKEAQIALSYGGDGTLLSLFRAVAKADRLEYALVAGLNKGTVGFMANDMLQYDFVPAVLDTRRDCIEQTPKHAKNLQLRHLLDVTVFEKPVQALNEVTFHPTVLGKLFVTHIKVAIPSMNIHNETITYKGDGIIIATASGSTAYNLSAGGPLLTPGDGNIVVSPIAPFSLAARPIVFPVDTRMEITFESTFNMAIDGIVYDDLGYEKVNISISDKRLFLFKQDSFFETIQTKLGWNNSIK